MKHYQFHYLNFGIHDGSQPVLHWSLDVPLTVGYIVNPHNPDPQNRLSTESHISIFEMKEIICYLHKFNILVYFPNIIFRILAKQRFRTDYGNFSQELGQFYIFITFEEQGFSNSGRPQQCTFSVPRSLGAFVESAYRVKAAQTPKIPQSTSQFSSNHNYESRGRQLFTRP